MNQVKAHFVKKIKELNLGEKKFIYLTIILNSFDQIYDFLQGRILDG